MDSTSRGPGATRPGEGGGRLISETGLMSERGVCERGREVEEGATREWAGYIRMPAARVAAWGPDLNSTLFSSGVKVGG